MVVELQLLGRFSARRAGEEIPPASFRGRLVRRLVRILVTRRGTFVPRDVLVEALWPARPPANPDLNLNVAINRARRALEDASLIVTGPGGYSFARGERCCVDAEVFMGHVETGRMHLASDRHSLALSAFRSAIEIWGGDALTEDAYEDWAQEYRSRISRAHLEALEGAARAALGVGDPGHALAYAELAAQRDPLREASHLLVVESLAACGDTAGALDAFNRFRRLYAKELGLDPSSKALELEGRILRSEKVGARGHVAVPIRRPAVPVRAQMGDLAFVGRDEDLGGILGTVTPPVEGIAIISGLAGSGKSRLLAEFAHRSRLPAISARAFQTDREEGWALARCLLREALSLDVAAASGIPDRAAQALADIMPELDELRTFDALVLDAESRGALALEGAVRLLHTVGSKGAVVLVDDLQWADPTSLRVLREFVRRPPNVGLVLAYRPEEVADAGPVATFLRDLQQVDRSLQRCELGGLPPPAISRLVADEHLARAIVQETDRSPLAVGEVLRVLAAEGVVAPDGRGGWRALTGGGGDRARRAARAGRQRAVEARMERHPPRQQQLLRLLSLLARETPARLLAAAMRSDERAILDDLDVLARARLVRLGNDGWAMVHDAIAESVVEAMEPSQRGRLHELLAHVLRAEEAEPVELARHVLKAGDRQAAAGVFAEACRRSLDRFENEEAERLADEGMALDPSSIERTNLLEVRAEARARRGDVQGAREDLRDLVASLSAGPHRARVLARMAMLISGFQDPGQASELVDLALLESGSCLHTRAEVLAVGSIVDFNTNQLERGEERAAEARNLFQQLGHGEGLARMMDIQAMADLSRGRIGEAADLLDRVACLFHDTGMLMRVGTSRAYRALALLWMAEPRRALVDSTSALQLEKMLGNPEGEALALAIGSQALAALGRVEEAIRGAEEALAIVQRLGHREFTAMGLAFLGAVRHAAGDLDRAEAHLREALDAAKGMPIPSAWAAARLALLLIERGDLEAAGRYVAEALDDAVLPMSQYEARLASAELAFARKDPDATEIAAKALAAAEEGRHLVSAARLRRLVARATPAPAREGVPVAD